MKGAKRKVPVPRDATARQLVIEDTLDRFLRVLFEGMLVEHGVVSREELDELLADVEAEVTRHFEIAHLEAALAASPSTAPQPNALLDQIATPTARQRVADHSLAHSLCTVYEDKLRVEFGVSADQIEAIRQATRALLLAGAEQAYLEIATGLEDTP